MNLHRWRFVRYARKSMMHSCKGEYYALAARLEGFMEDTEHIEMDARVFIEDLTDFARRSCDYPPLQDIALEREEDADDEE